MEPRAVQKDSKDYWTVKLQVLPTIFQPDSDTDTWSRFH